MKTMRTMLIGLDVSHGGSKSVVGFAASINPQMSQYYSEYFIQSKNQELIRDRLLEKFKGALDAFGRNHGG